MEDALPSGLPYDSSEGHRSADIDGQARPPPKKRRRIVISCTECHRRKQKCDRNLPCANCVSRNKQDACRYETGAPTAREQELQGAGRIDTGQVKKDREGSLPTKVADFGYSQTGASTLGFLKKIDSANPEEPLSRLTADASPQNEHFGTRERYKTLIRQLPARPYVELLVDIYFRDFNWQYYPIDPDVFMSMLGEWYNLPFNLLTTQGPQGLPPELRVFPALLFQVLATALLVLPESPDATYDPLKYAANMTFQDLAMDYSESGIAIMSVLGKRQMSLGTVLAGFLRASFLKYTGLVTEAWHSLGSTIRDAQEIGLHKSGLDPKPRSGDAEAVLENQWEIQRRRRMWMILLGWDLHMGIVLGRPTSIDKSLVPTLPVDAPIPLDRSKTPVLLRDENDPPTPITRALWSHETNIVLRDIMELEQDGPCPKNFSKVDKVHEMLVALRERTPPYFRSENPDTRYDALPECYWVPYVRATLPQLLSFDFMALHRPYIFTRAKSRSEALRASLAMLQAQRLHFQTLKPEQYKIFTIFFGTFDAIVLMSSIYILFPKEHPEQVQNAMQHFQWSMERFEVMSERNTLARAAVSVLHAIYMRLKKSLGMEFASGYKSPAPTNETPGSIITDSAATSNIDPSLTDGSLNGSSGASTSYTPMSASSTSDPYASMPTSSTTPPGLDLNFPPDFDWGSIQPIFPMNDLAYNDLMGIGTEGGVIAADVPDVPVQLPVHFEGDFHGNSLWNVLNQYTV